MTAGTADPSPQKRLGDGISHFRICGGFLSDRHDVISNRGVLVRCPFSQQDIGGDFFPATPSDQLLSQPPVQRPHSFGAANIVIPFAAILHDITKLQCPEVDEFGPLQQLIDQPRPFVGIGI